MKSKLKRILSVGLMAGILSLGAMFTALAADEDILAQGTSGDITWKLNNSGLLTLEGTGDYKRTYKSSSLVWATLPWHDYCESIKTAKVNIDGTTDTSSMFEGCSNLTSVDLSGLNTSGVTSMDSMFSGCSSLQELDVSNFNTSNVIDMNFMFANCSSLENLNLGNFNTSNVTNMSVMFQGCNALTELNIDNFNTSKVTNMSYMFSGCSGLQNLNLNNFNTSNVTNMKCMFQMCNTLAALNISNFDTSKVTDMSGMFNGCNNLQELNVSNFNTLSVTDMQNMFAECKKLTNLAVNNFDTSEVTNMQYMFNNCNNLQELDISNFNTSKVTNMRNMFHGCSSLQELDVSNFDTSEVTNMQYMFNECSNLKTVDLNNLDASKVTNMSYMFNDCRNLTNIDFNNFAAAGVTNMSYMFNNCNNLQSLDLSGFKVTAKLTLTTMFNGCDSLESLNLSNFDLSKTTTSITSLISKCENLQRLYTPVNVKKSISLPRYINGGDWYIYETNEKVTSVPQNLDHSLLLLIKKRISTRLSGETIVGKTLTANITPSDATVDVEWFRADSKEGPWTKIEGEADNTYTLTDEDIDKFIKAVVTGTGDYEGEKEVISDKVIKTTDNTDKNIKLVVTNEETGETPSSVKIGDTLVADIIEYDVLPDNVSYVWLTEDDDKLIIREGEIITITDELIQDYELSGRKIYCIAESKTDKEFKLSSEMILVKIADKTDTNSAECNVIVSQGQSFSVTIPAFISMNGEKNVTNEADFYTVVVADIAGGDTIEVKPVKLNVVLSQAGKKDLEAEISTTEGWNYEISKDGVSEDDLSGGVRRNHKISVAKLSAGRWRGTFNWSITTTGEKIKDSEEYVEYRQFDSATNEWKDLGRQ